MKLTLISVEFHGRKVAVFTYTRNGRISVMDLQWIAKKYLGMPDVRGLTFSYG